MSDDWEDEFAVTGEVTKVGKSSTKHGSPVPLSKGDWEDEFAVTGKRDEKQKNIKSKPSGPMAGTKTDSMLTSIFGPVNRAMRSLPLGLDTMEKKINPSLVKGIPVAGQMVPQTEELTQFEENNPGTATALNLAGGVGATLPMSVGVAANTSAKLLPQALNQGMLGATLSTGDTLAEKGLETTGDEFNKSAMSGFAGGSLGAALGRLITPSVPMNKRQIAINRQSKIKPEPNLTARDIHHRSHSGDPSVEQSTKMLMEALYKNKPVPQAGTSPEAERVMKALLMAGMGGAISHGTGFGPVPGILIGGATPYVGPAAKKITDRWSKNQLMNKPTVPRDMYEPYWPNKIPSQLPRHILHALGIEAGG